jgi:Flp pilus assembly protein TadD
MAVRTSNRFGVKGRTFALVMLLAGLGTVAGCGSTGVEATRLSLPASVPDVPEGTEMQAAVSAFEEGNFGYAARYFDQADESEEACLGLAASYDWLYRFDLADRAYDRCGEIAGQGFAYYNNLGFSYLLRGDTERAAASFGRAEAFGPSHPVVQTNRRILRDAISG